jgi:aspartate/methionine/tyrosine aminotransferase
MASVQAPVIPILERWMAETPGTISLGQGLVSFGPPQEAIEAARRFGSAPGDHRYGPNEGIPALVEALEEKLARENGVSVRPASRVFVTAGGNLAFMTAIFAVMEIGDEVIMPAPFYFNHEMAIVMACGTPVPVATRDDYQLDVDAIAAAMTPRTRAIVTVSPNNPTGAVYPEASLRAVNQLCRDRGVFHIHDEAYEYFVHGGATHFSPGAIAGAADHTISLFTLSKAYGMASWRVGYMVIPERLTEAVRKAQDTILICPAVISQQAALGALLADPAERRENVRRVGEVRHMVLDALQDVRSFATIPPALGAFYLLMRIDTRLDSMAIVERLVREFGVAVIPGNTFGIESGCSLRVAYGALARDTIAEGVGRLVRGLNAIVKG